jgi:hypothetical protein
VLVKALVSFSTEVDWDPLFAVQGKPVRDPKYANSSFYNSEYLLYQESQHRIRYVVEISMWSACDHSSVPGVTAPYGRDQQMRRIVNRWWWSIISLMRKGALVTLATLAYANQIAEYLLWGLGDGGMMDDGWLMDDLYAVTGMPCTASE